VKTVLVLQQFQRRGGRKGKKNARIREGKEKKRYEDSHQSRSSEGFPVIKLKIRRVVGACERTPHEVAHLGQGRQRELGGQAKKIPESRGPGGERWPSEIGQASARHKSSAKKVF